MELSYKIIEYKSPEYWDEVDLRNRVLRYPLGMEFTDKEMEQEVDQMHLGTYLEGKLAACLVLVHIDDRTLKMRQVAVEPELQRKGIGQQLVSFAERHAIENGYCRIELHARQTVVQFYLDLGYTIIGDPFTEVTLPHRKMIKDWCAAIGD